MHNRLVTDIGKIEQENIAQKGMSIYDTFAENPFPKVENWSILTLSFKDGKFEEISSHKGNFDNYTQYAYKKGSARGGDITFSTKLSNPSQSLKTVIDTQFSKFLKYLKDNFPDEYPVWYPVFENLTKNRIEIEEKLTKYYENLNKDEKTKCLVSFEIDGKFLANFEACRELVIQDGLNFTTKYGVTSQAKNQVCSVCMKEQPLVGGFGMPFKYSTIDKAGFIPGFDKKFAWRNMPVCSDCNAKMYLGKQYIFNNSRYSFYGTSFFIIPKPIIGNDLKTLKRVKETFHRFKYDEGQKGGDAIQRQEDRLMRKIAKEGNDEYTLNLMFFEEASTSKAINILMTAEEILPSRFQKIFQTVPNKIEKHPDFIGYTVNKDKSPKDLKFYFGLLKVMYPTTKEFLEITGKILRGDKINRQGVLTRIMQVYSQTHAKSKEQNYRGYNPKTVLLIGRMLFMYFQELNLLK